MLVQRGVYEAFASLVTEKARALRVGHGIDAATTMGPVTVPQGLSKCAEQIDDARARGARILIGGSRVKQDAGGGGGGYFFEPTVVADATSDMRVAGEETFAPLLALFPFETEEEAVRAANDTSVCDCHVM